MECDTLIQRVEVPESCLYNRPLCLAVGEAALTVAQAGVIVGSGLPFPIQREIPLAGAAWQLRHFHVKARRIPN